MKRQSANEKGPYIPSDKGQKEMTVTSVIIGALLAAVFGAANAYLGLRVAMTISASIPAAVISMGIIRVIMKRDSILENNMVQTIGSAGESLAAGVIFTMPAMFMWAKEGRISPPSINEITTIALCGGVLGVLFMIPIRNMMIVREKDTLLYPEGTACADVLMAGEKGGKDAVKVFSGLGIAAAFKFIFDGLKVASSDISIVFKRFRGEIGVEVYPALLGVGFIIGPKISSFMFMGSVVGWMIFVPLVCLFGADASLYPAENGVTISQIYASGGASAICAKYVKYIGAGAVATGGFIALLRQLPGLFSAFREMIVLSRSKDGKTARTEKDIPFFAVAIGTVFCIVAMCLLPAVPVNILCAVLIALFGFFFTTVSSRMVGLIGGSNNPIAGMVFATLLVSTMVLKSLGNTGIGGMAAALAIGSIVCVITAIAGDMSQDLKTGYIVGATPWKQEIGELIGVVASSLVIGGVLYLLDKAWGFGNAQIPAPQATLMKLIIEGIMGGKLPWTLVFIGVCLALVMEVLRVPVMPFAIGLYLPIYTTAGVMLGSMAHLVMDTIGKDTEVKKARIYNGTLYCAGMIAGEGLVGILLAFFAVAGVNIPSLAATGTAGGVIAAAAILALLFVFSIR